VPRCPETPRPGLNPGTSENVGGRVMASRSFEQRRSNPVSIEPNPIFERPSNDARVLETGASVPRLALDTERLSIQAIHLADPHIKDALGYSAAELPIAGSYR
jgi:hypothetical protein